MGGRGQSIKLYSKCKQKLVVCLAKQTLLFFVSVKLCVLESCICLRRVSGFPPGDVPLELDGWRRGAEPRQRGAGGRGAGEEGASLAPRGDRPLLAGKLIVHWANRQAQGKKWQSNPPTGAGHCSLRNS